MERDSYLVFMRSGTVKIETHLYDISPYAISFITRRTLITLKILLWIFWVIANLILKFFLESFRWKIFRKVLKFMTTSDQ